MDKRSIEPYVRAPAVALYQSGLNLSKISKQLQVSRCCVRNAITKFEEYTKFDDVKRSGRPKSLSDRNIHELKRLVQGDNRLSAGKNNNRLKHESIQASVQAYGASIFEEAWLRVCSQNKKTMTEYEASKSSRTVV